MMTKCVPRGGGGGLSFSPPPSLPTATCALCHGPHDRRGQPQAVLPPLWYYFALVTTTPLPARREKDLQGTWGTLT